jgi:hypothetical protein
VLAQMQGKGSDGSQVLPVEVVEPGAVGQRWEERTAMPSQPPRKAALGPELRPLPKDRERHDFTHGKRRRATTARGRRWHLGLAEGTDRDGPTRSGRSRNGTWQGLCGNSRGTHPHRIASRPVRLFRSRRSRQTPDTRKKRAEFGGPSLLYPCTPVGRGGESFSRPRGPRARVACCIHRADGGDSKGCDAPEGSLAARHVSGPGKGFAGRGHESS